MNLEGTWYVIASNFPLWTKGNRTQPRFIYSNLRSVDGRECMDDTVQYVEGGRSKTIVGIDTQEQPGKPSYLWRGRGLLKLFTSRWEIISVASDEKCLALSFTKTWVTPAGVDIISRTRLLSEDAYASMICAIGSPSLTRLKWTES